MVEEVAMEEEVMEEVAMEEEVMEAEVVETTEASNATEHHHLCLCLGCC